MRLIPLPPLSDKAIVRFWKYVDVRGPDECWPWKGAAVGGGYGVLRVAGKSIRANRIAYFLQHGIDPFPLLSLHACDNPPCCNWKHLFRGTDQDNSDDMYAKGRGAIGDRSGSHLHPERRARGDRNGAHTHPERVPRGERNGSSKLTAEQVAEIRRRHAAGGVTYADLGKEFKVTYQNISILVRKKTWR